MEKFRDVSGKVAIVTGAARGLGFECAKTLAEAGVHVIIADVLTSVKEVFEEIRKDCPDNLGWGTIVDVSCEEQVKHMIEEVVEKFGHLDIMCNNAGINGGEYLVTNAPEAVIDKVFAVNVKGTFFSCKYAGMQMMKQKSGTIVNTGSFYGKVGHAASAVYGASKGAIHTLTQSFALEMAPYGVTVNAVCPALAATEMHWAYLRKQAAEEGVTFESLCEAELPGIPMRRLGTGKDSAGAVLWLASESGSYVTGQLINVNGGLDFT